MKRIIKMPRKTIITLLILCGLIVSIPFTVRAYNNQNYNNYLKKGEKYLIEENYEEAVYSFDNALKYNKSEEKEINKLIERAVRMNKSMNSFESGAKLFYEKKYEEAIAAFEKVNIEDTRRYDIAHERIKECQNGLTALNIARAKNEALNLNYDKAIAYLDSVLRVDPVNQEAMLLKQDYTNKLITLAAAK